jgi:hypothetical protein
VPHVGIGNQVLKQFQSRGGTAAARSTGEWSSAE